jgi:hypothetical protein
MKKLIFVLLLFFALTSCKGHDFFWSYSNYCYNTLPDNLISYYKINDTANPIVDSAGSSDLTNTGGALSQTGILNTCVGFDGSAGKYISGTAAYSHQTYNSVTVSLWFKLNSVTGTQKIYNDLFVLGASPLHIGFSIYASGTNFQPGWQTYATAGTQTWSSVLSTDTWYNVTCTINRADGTLVTYFNGVMHSSGATAIGFVADEFQSETYIGRNAGSDVQPINGYIDDVKIWNRELLDCEIKANYNSGVGIEL